MTLQRELTDSAILARSAADDVRDESLDLANEFDWAAWVCDNIAVQLLGDDDDRLTAEDRREFAAIDSDISDVFTEGLWAHLKGEV